MKSSTARLLRAWAAHMGATQHEVKRAYLRLPAKDKQRARVAIARELGRPQRVLPTARYDEYGFRVGPIYHAHSLDAVNRGEFVRGDRCDDCPPPDPGAGSMTVTSIDRDVGTITMERS